MHRVFTESSSGNVPEAPNLEQKEAISDDENSVEAEESENEHKREEACATWNAGKAVGLSSTNDDFTIQAILEERLEAKQRSRSKNKQKELKRKRRKQLCPGGCPISK